MALELSTREDILKTIVGFPGLHFRELKRRTGLAVGTLRYHLDVMQEAQLIIEEKQDEKSRLYPPDLSQQDRRILGLLRQRNLRRTIVHLIDNPGATNKEICRQLEVSPSTQSWYLDKLKRSEVVEFEVEGRNHRYYVQRQPQILRLLKRFKGSFTDTVIDNFIELWDL